MRVVSMPSWELFEQQDEAYREEVLPEALPRGSRWNRRPRSAGRATSGRRGAVVGMHTFGASAPLKGLLTKFGFTPDHVVTIAKEQITSSRPG